MVYLEFWGSKEEITCQILIQAAEKIGEVCSDQRFGIVGFLAIEFR